LKSVLSLSLSFLFPAALSAADEGIPFQPAASGEKPSTLFTELSAKDTGLDFINPVDETHPSRYLYASSMATSGVALGDVDGDGWTDVFLGGGPVPNKLFRQKAPLVFEDITETSGLGGNTSWAVGNATVDIDNDGDLDLFVCNYLSPNQLFINDGKGRFEEKGKAYGLDAVDASHTPAFCDYDGDGDMDLYLLTNRWYYPDGSPEEETITTGPDGRPTIKQKFEKYYDVVQTGDDKFETMASGRPDRLYKNNGDGTFTDVSKEAGITHRGFGLSATWWDWNGDSHPDIWIANDFDDKDRLYQNNGDGTFADVTDTRVGNATWFSMGADFGDVNGDAKPDFLIADMAGNTHFKAKTAMGSMSAKSWFLDNAKPAQTMRNCLFLNSGTPYFLEAGQMAGLAKTNWTWASRLCDFDNDGRNDVYFQCGASRNFNEKDDPDLAPPDGKTSQWDRYKHLPPMLERNMAFRNDGDLRFKDVSKKWGLDHLGVSYGCAVADLDKDGNLDIVSVRLDEPVAIFHHNGGAGNSVTFSFQGKDSPRFGNGVEAILTAGGEKQIRTLTTSRGYLGCDAPELHFGLGDTEKIDSVEFRWPSGARQTLTDLKAGRHYTITEGVSEKGSGSPAPPEKTLFKASPLLAATRHVEAPFDDYAKEPLLPNRMSRFGPGHAWGDINGDGIDELFVGGGYHTDRRVYIRTTDGNFKPVTDIPFGDSRDFEDMGAVFFDADSDGDNDLYVASGGVEGEDGKGHYQDRLYLNAGKGLLSRAPDGSLPIADHASGPVAAADFDRDGDIDIFVGGRGIPGQYPLAGTNQLLRNDGGKFSEAIPDIAPDLAETGMVTGATWADMDGDGWQDLVLSHEWGSVAVFLNEKGKLKRLADEGLGGKNGWWNGVTAADIDNDGDLDLIATNFGLNTKYHASDATPALLYYGDLDGTGKAQIVEAEFEDGKLFPVRGKSCSSLAMPFISKKFETYKAFASATIPEIYPEEKLESGKKFSANELRTMVFRNDGKCHFTAEPLPWLAQIAPSFGVEAGEFNGDVYPDIVLAQNFFSPQRETGPMNGGLSLFLAGNKDGGFTPFWPDKSGVSESGDSKSLTISDMNSDGYPDLAFGRNSAPASAFLSASNTGEKIFSIRLDTQRKGNRNGIGARVSVKTSDGTIQTSEMTSGSGYLSQSPAVKYFGYGGDGNKVVAISVRWPDGSVSEIPDPPVEPGKQLAIGQPLAGQ